MKENKPYRVILWGLLAVSFTGVLTATVMKGKGRNQDCCTPMVTQPEDMPVMFALPDFSLTERNGETVTLASLAGKVWIADFIFTNCPGPCPLMTSKMAQLQSDLTAPDIHFVTITVDPANDTPEKLKQYARGYQADPRRWWFLTGDVEKIYDLSVKGFRLAAQTQTAPSADHPILHSTRFVLVDREGRIRGYYEGTDTEALKKLRNDASKLLKEIPRG